MPHLFGTIELSPQVERRFARLQCLGHLARQVALVCYPFEQLGARGGILFSREAQGGSVLRGGLAVCALDCRMFRGKRGEPQHVRAVTRRGGMMDQPRDVDAPFGRLEQRYWSTCACRLRRRDADSALLTASLASSWRKA